MALIASPLRGSMWPSWFSDVLSEQLAGE